MGGAFLVVDKPAGITSHDVVAMVRAVTGIKKVGHTGTLDPFATGVLPLALGNCTRLIRFLDERLKVYDGTISLGTATTTGDPEGEVNRTGPPADFSKVEQVLAGFIGPRMQTPPAYSAVKLKGRPLYKYAREGEMKVVPARAIEIMDMKELDRGDDMLRVEIHCSRGTYARVLADEVATELGTAGHLVALRRLRSGPFFIDGALTLEQLSMLAAGSEDWKRCLGRRPKGEERVPWKPRDEVMAGLESRFVAPKTVLAHLPVVRLNADQRRRVESGGPLPRAPEGHEAGAPFALMEGEELMAVIDTKAQPNRAVVVARR